MKVDKSLRLTFFSILLVVFQQQISFSQTIYTLNIKNEKTLKAYFKRTNSEAPIISGHRGGMTKGFPENSIETFENTLKYTPAFFEIDPRLTKDSIPVLMHDATLDRTTTGTGKVGDYTLAELKKFKLKDPEGNVTEFKIPTLLEALVWSKGKTVMNLDHKDVPYAMVAKIIKESGNQAVMITVHSAKQAQFYLDLNPNRMFSAHILTKKAFLEYESAGIPWQNMIAYIGPKNKPENKELLDLLHAKGVMCMISAAPSYDKLKSPVERAENYRQTFLQGADILESDLPVEVGEAIKQIVPKKYAKQKFIATKKLK